MKEHNDIDQDNIKGYIRAYAIRKAIGFCRPLILIVEYMFHKRRKWACALEKVKKQFGSMLVYMRI